MVSIDSFLYNFYLLVDNLNLMTHCHQTFLYLSMHGFLELFERVCHGSLEVHLLPLMSGSFTERFSCFFFCLSHCFLFLCLILNSFRCENWPFQIICCSNSGCWPTPNPPHSRRHCCSLVCQAAWLGRSSGSLSLPQCGVSCGSQAGTATLGCQQSRWHPVPLSISVTAVPGYCLYCCHTQLQAALIASWLPYFWQFIINVLHNLIPCLSPFAGSFSRPFCEVVLTLLSWPSLWEPS